MATPTSRKSCSKCDKGTGAFSCDGCQQSFCLKHVAEHRQELISQMDNIEFQHDIINEDLVKQVQKQNEHILFEQINQWEKESIDKIEQIAKTSRITLHEILDNIIDHGKKSLNKISIKLRQARELDDFFENDLTRWTQQLNQLRTENECMMNSIHIMNDNSSSVIKLIKITHNQTINNSDKNSPGNFSWLSDMKALFYDQPEKTSSSENNETKKYSTQICTKGSIGIIKVNNMDHYIDVENDGWTNKDQNMAGWTLRRDADRKSRIIYKFPENFILKCQSNVRILCGKKCNTEEKHKEIIIVEISKPWDIGTHVITYLIDDNGEERASVTQTLVPL
ncbi:unnamed protein product [Adineta steineri]|uniref:LTD domain-containing protein n=1 Tax=Adineta steineri TaxID=433720 RepID=A0A815GTL9_9BILA|nr:unnamed protein product [Adineta steineri]CAF3711064.1 unnamed protein product [Adineta steineri]